MSPTYGAGPAPAIADSGARKVAVLAGEPDGQASRPTSYQIQAIRAELIGSDTCTAAGITARGNAPVLALCRQLLAAGHRSRPARLEVYRGATLALTRPLDRRGGAARNQQQGDRVCTARRRAYSPAHAEKPASAAYRAAGPSWPAAPDGGAA